MLISARGITLCCLSLLPLPAQAQFPASVEVRTAMVLKRYRDHFVANRDSVEAAAAEIFADFLRVHGGFLRYVVGDSAPVQRISFLLDRKERQTTGSFPEVGFHVQLDRPQEDSVTFYWMTLRPAEQATSGVGSAADFLTELRTKLHLGADPVSLRDSILRHVPLTNTAMPTLEPLGLVLPFALQALCMKDESELEFVAELPAPTKRRFRALVTGFFPPPVPPSPATQPFVEGVWGEVDNAPGRAALVASVTQKTATVKQVFVTLYRRDPNACLLPGPVGGGPP